MSQQIEYIKAYQLLWSNWKEKVQFSLCEYLVTRRWHTGDYNLFLEFYLICLRWSTVHLASGLGFYLPQAIWCSYPLLFFSLPEHRFTHCLTLTCTSYTQLHPSVHLSPPSAPDLSFCEKSNPLLCHLIELLRLLLFYLSVCWSLREVGGRLSPALSVKVSEPRMKLCRSDECHRLTANFHQSNCGRGGPRRRTPGGLFPLSRFTTTYQAYWLTVWRHGSAVCSDLESTRSAESCNSHIGLTPVYNDIETRGTAKEIANNAVL